MPVVVPSACGVKVIFTVHENPFSTVAQVLFLVKEVSSSSEMEEMVRVEMEEFLIVTFLEAEAVFRAPCRN